MKSRSRRGYRTRRIGEDRLIASRIVRLGVALHVWGQRHLSKRLQIDGAVEGNDSLTIRKDFANSSRDAADNRGGADLHTAPRLDQALPRIGAYGFEEEELYPSVVGIGLCRD